MSAVDWMPATEVAALLRVTEARLAQVAHLTSPRLAQLGDGSRQQQLDASRVWRVARSLGVVLPSRFPAPAPNPAPPPPSSPHDPANDWRARSIVATALRRP